VALKLVTAPANEPITLDEAKAHLNVEHDEHDTLIAIYVAAATSYIDGPRGFLGRALIDQTWDFYLDEFPSDCTGDLSIELPLPPLIEVVGLFYSDDDGNETQLTADTDFIVDSVSEPARLVPVSSWPTEGDRPNAVRVRFRAGYIDASVSPAEDAVPFAIKAAELLHVGDLYRNREIQVVGETVAQLPWAAEQLLRPFRFYLSLA